MGNILDYLDWRGDLTFEQTPFNQVDNLILACFSYLDLDEIADAKKREYSFCGRISLRYFPQKRKGWRGESRKCVFCKIHQFFLKKWPAQKDFGNAGQEDMLMKSFSGQAQQFSAVTVGTS